jgi:hypothetical protein
MPPRYAYWTILVDNQPTAFRAGSMEDLTPTFKRLKEKHPSAVMMWFQNGKLWNSRLDAQEAMRARGERGREGDARQGGGFRDRKRTDPGRQERFEDRRPGDRRPTDRRSSDHRPENPRSNERAPLEWKPKGSFDPAPPRRTPEGRPAFREKPQRLDWKPRPKDGNRPRSTDRPRSTERPKLEWKPKSSAPSHRDQAPSKPVRRDKNWRPGGEHKDPRQKYKDAKKAKWQRFKSNIRSKWEAKKGAPPRPGAPRPRAPRKRRDDES